MQLCFKATNFIGMQRYHLIWLLPLIALCCFSCGTDEEIIGGNQAPPDNTIEPFLINDYANKVYITLLGREPSESELSDALAILNANGFSETDRQNLLDDVMQHDAFYRTTYLAANAEYLNSLDSVSVVTSIFAFQLILMDAGQMALWPYANNEIDRLEEYRSSVQDMIDGTISVREFHARCINNFEYDQLNMGTENFVVSSFEHFLNRYPTDSELEQGKLMVDGFNGVLFFEIGNDKNDYLNVFFNSDGYNEGQVVHLFNKYLFKDPTSEEMTFYSERYKQSDDYKELVKLILSRDEFAGL